MDEAERPRSSLPDVREIGLNAPIEWLKGGFSDFGKAFGPCIFYGAALALISAMFATGLLFSGQASWIMVFAGGFLFIAPMIAMGLYEAGRQLELGQTPTLREMLVVKTASAQNLAYLGLALLIVYFFWTRMAQLIYALSTYTLHESVGEFLTFMFTTSAGHSMAMTGTVVGGIIAFIAFSLVVVSAPMLLDRKTDVFIATVTSVRSVAKNPAPMLLWAVMIAVLTAIGLVTAFIGLVAVFPVIGLSSWRAYRALVVSPD